MGKMPKFKHIEDYHSVDLGYGDGDEFTIAELKERILSREGHVHGGQPIDLDTVKIELSHDNDPYSGGTCWAHLNVRIKQVVTVEMQEEQWRFQQNVNEEYARKADKLKEAHDRAEYERLKKKFGSGENDGSSG